MYTYKLKLGLFLDFNNSTACKDMDTDGCTEGSVPKVTETIFSKNTVQNLKLPLSTKLTSCMNIHMVRYDERRYTIKINLQVKKRIGKTNMRCSARRSLSGLGCKSNLEAYKLERLKEEHEEKLRLMREKHAVEIEVIKNESEAKIKKLEQEREAMLEAITEQNKIKKELLLIEKHVALKKIHNNL